MHAPTYPTLVQDEMYKYKVSYQQEHEHCIIEQLALTVASIQHIFGCSVTMNSL